MRKPRPDSRIGAAILAAGLTQAVVAERCGINPARISRFANGRQQPTVAQLDLLAEAIGCPAHELMGDPLMTQTG